MIKMPSTSDDTLYSEIPLFAPPGHEIPRIPSNKTAEDLPPALGALSHLLYDEETPEEKAELLRERGNELLKRGGIKQRDIGRMYLKKAIQVYTEVIAIDCSDKHVAAAGYANRAEANLRLKNYGYVLEDCEQALRLDSMHVKALYRGARAAFALGKFGVARNYSRRALKLNDMGLIGKKEVEAFQGMLKIVESEEKKEERRKVEKEERLKNRAEGEKRLHRILKERHVQIGVPLFGQQRRYTNVKPRIEENDELTWPLLVVYPEGVNEGVEAQSDYIEEVHEDTMLGDVVEMLWPEGQQGAKWDIGRVYSRGKKELKLLYRTNWTCRMDEVDEEDRESTVGSQKGPQEVGEWITIAMGLTLKELLSKKDYITPLFPVIYLVPRRFVPP